MSKYFFEIERKFQLEGRGSAVDVEIFSNAALLPAVVPLNDETRQERLDQLEELLRRFRQTEQTCLTMPATHHAVARAFVDGGNTDSLLRILNNRVEFGIFPDNYTYTYLLEHFLSNENFRDGARVAVALMLQEEFKIPIASQMALYSTYSYVQNLKDQVQTLLRY
jgi:small subunit ribosomal protein S27